MSTPRSRGRVAASLALALGVTIAAPQIAQSRVVDDVTDAPADSADSTPSADAASSAPEGGDPAGGTADEEMPESATGLYIVRLADEPLATYAGGVEGLAATSPQATGEARLDTASRDSRDYLQHLAELQEEAGLQIESLLSRDLQIADHYTHALNGFSLELSAEEAAALVGQPGIVAVEPDQQWELDTDVSNDIINSPAIWAGETGSEVGTLGEGVIVGMLDTGVNFEHPSFAATDGEGYTHTNPYGTGNYVGVCAPDAPDHEDICNDKLIGAYNFTGTFSATDDNGHGSHTGSTMAGNQHTAVFDVGADTYELPVSGVAPHANVISYKVCAFLCSSTASVAAVEQAIIDGTDVLNYSISGPDNPWNNSVDLAFLSATEAGIYVAASAGNDGPGAGTVAKTAPWNAAVAATNSPRLIAHDVSVTGPTPVPEQVTGLAGVPGSGPGVTSPIEAEIREASVVDPGNGGGCEDFPDGAFEGALALIERGGCDFSAKVGNAEDAGALAVIMVNQFPGPPVVMGGLENTDIPAVMVANGEGVGLREFVVANPGTTLRLDSGSVLTMTPEWSTMVADFSSRGPSEFDLLAPTFAAPGRNILAATMASTDDASTYEFMQGTSMSSPHGAGAGALLRALHADWSPVMIRSALASTANPEGMIKDDGTTPADPYDVGSGLVDLDAAGRVGLVMDESIEDFQAADPELGGDPKTLNLPAFVDQNCLDTCSWTREVTNVADVATAYSTSVTPPEGVSMTVEPASFTVEPGATQTLTVTADVSSLTGGAALFGDVQVTTDGTHAGGADIADVHYPVALVKGEAEMVLEPTELTTLLGVDEQEVHTVTMTNAGGAPMEWALDQGGDCALPAWVSADPTSGSIAAGESQELTVTFDSSDLAGGDYAASLCVTSNDPHTPVATVALALEVVEIPVIEVGAQDLSATQPAGTVTSEPLTIGNTGYGELDWTLADPDAGPSDERIELLQQGVLLVPNSDRNNRGVMAFDAQDGTLIDGQFIPPFNYSDGTLYTPSHALANADNTGFLLTDQINDVITEYDLDGNYRGIFAPSPAGEDPSVMLNIRGMAWSPQGTLLVTVASGVNADSVVEFDADGTFLGHFIEPELGGLDGPWFVTFRDDDVLVSASGSEAIHSYSRDGKTSNGTFTTQMRWPEQMTETEEDTLLVANLSSGTGLLDRGVYEFSADGEQLGGWTIPGSTSYTGVHPLGNGNVLAATEDGVFELSRDGEVEAEAETGRGRFISEVQMPDLMPCQTPDEVAWLDVEPVSGQTLRGEVSHVRVLLDSTGLAAGDYTANLCVSSDDPATPYVPVPVTMTVTDQACDTTVSGVHDGPLSATDGLTCLAAGAEVAGPVTVRDGSLYADDVTIEGPLSGNGASGVEVTDTVIDGPLTLRGGTGVITVDGNVVDGATTLDRNSTGGAPILLADNAIDGALGCSRNTPPPTNDGRPNEVEGTRSGQCADL